jgi:hypothetical protein
MHIFFYNESIILYNLQTKILVLLHNNISITSELSMELPLHTTNQEEANPYPIRIAYSLENRDGKIPFANISIPDQDTSQRTHSRKQG